MENDPQAIVEERLAELPPDVRDAILSNDLGNKVRVIAERNHLHIDQTGALEEETVLVMLGFTEPGAFIQQLTEALHIEETLAITLANEIQEEIFLPIRESMKLFMQQRSQSAAAKEAAVPAPALVPAAVTAPALPTVERMLTEPTLSAPLPSSQKETPPSAPPTYSTDPYREPAE